MIFGVPPFLCTPYKPLTGLLTKNDAILARAVEHPENFLVSPRSGDVELLVAHALTSPDNATWEVWRNDTFVGIIHLDHIVPECDARLHFVFLDNVLADKAALLRTFVQQCFTLFGFERLSFEVPDHLSTLQSFARRHLGFRHESGTRSRRERAYFDGDRWHDVVLLRLLAEEVAQWVLGPLPSPLWSSRGKKIL